MSLLDSVLSLLAPHNCLICNAEGKLVCGWCAPDAFPAVPSRCYRCQRLATDFAVCAGCRKQTPLRHVWVRTEYGGDAKVLLRRYKYERVRAAAVVIADAMSEVLPYMPSGTLVIPVPTATSRARQRGYDHAALLARWLARERNLVWQHGLTHLTQSRQVGASREKRLTQLTGSLMVTHKTLLKNTDILLIDDVVTTGSTLETAAAALKKAGAKSVSALVFAQKQ